MWFPFLYCFILWSLLIRYIVLPANICQDIYNSTGLKTTKWCREIFDCMLNIFTEDHQLILLQSHRQWLCICRQGGNRKVGKWKHSCWCMLLLPYLLSVHFLPDANFFWQGLTLVFGVMFRRNATRAGHAFNWYLTTNLSSVIFFEPQNRNEMANPHYSGSKNCSNV